MKVAHAVSLFGAICLCIWTCQKDMAKPAKGFVCGGHVSVLYKQLSRSKVKACEQKSFARDQHFFFCFSNIAVLLVYLPCQADSKGVFSPSFNNHQGEVWSGDVHYGRLGRLLLKRKKRRGRGHSEQRKELGVMAF